MNHGARILAAAMLIGLAANATAQTTGTPGTTSPPPVSTPPDFPRGRFSGVVFIDAYYNVAGDPKHRYNSSGADSTPVGIDGSFGAGSQPKLIGKDLNGLLLRRAYLTYDNDLSAKYAVRFRLEADSKSLTSDSKIGVNVKAAYVQVKNVFTRASLFVGMTNNPMWENAEEAWGYRSVEKTLADFRGLASSVDMGVQLKGALDAGKRIGYNAMLGTGAGQKVEDNRYKRTYLSFPLRPIENLSLEPFVDYEWAAGNKDKATYKLFAGYELKRAAIGAEIVDRLAHETGKPNKEPFGLSLFGRWMPRPEIAAFARYDRWQPDTRAADRIDSELWIAGLDWQPYKDVHIMPNVLTTQYFAKGNLVAPPHHDMQARVTLYWKFSKP
jgi:hypothetical protein